MVDFVQKLHHAEWHPAKFMMLCWGEGGGNEINKVIAKKHCISPKSGRCPGCQDAYSFYVTTADENRKGTKQNKKSIRLSWSITMATNKASNFLGQPYYEVCNCGKATNIFRSGNNSSGLLKAVAGALASWPDSFDSKQTPRHVELMGCLKKHAPVSKGS